jgi:hypothetical protein
MLFSATISAQNKNVKIENSIITNAEASIILPMGKLADKFNFAHSYGFWFTLGKENKINCDIGATIIILDQASAIDYEFENSNHVIKSNKFGLDFGIKASKDFNVSSKSSINTGIVFGIHYLDYDYPKDSDESKKNNNPYYFKNSTILLAPEIKYMYKNTGVKCQYRFTPFNMIDEFPNRFGSHSISFGIVYRQ